MSLTCPSCGNEEPEGAAFCGNCGAALVQAEPEPPADSGNTVTCASCGNEDPEGSSFCGNCGASLLAAAPEPANAQPVPAPTEVTAPPAPPQGPSMRQRFAGRTPVVIAVVLLLLVAAGVAAVLVTRSSGSKKSPQLQSRTPFASQSSAAGGCSLATAREVGKPYFFDPNMSRPIGQVLCGPFAGTGSQAMVIAFTAPTCWPIQRWAVFRRSGGAWRLAIDVPTYLVPPLVVVGSDIRETTAVSRPGDPRCIPSGGSHARLWHWDGERFTAGAWQQVTPGTTTTSPSTGVATSGYFKTPTHNIVCYHSTGTTFSILTCGIKSGLRPAPPRRTCTEGDYAGDRVVLQDTGTVRVPSCAGDPGPFVGVGTAPVLVYGKRWAGGGLRCTSRFRGLTCRNSSGHGFFLSREHWRSF